MVTSADINLGDNATIHYLATDEYIIYDEDYKDYKDQGANLVELTAQIVCVHSVDGKFSNGEPIKINKVFLITDKKVPFFFFFDKNTIEDFNDTLIHYSNSRNWLGNIKDYSGKYGSWVHISRIHSVSSNRIDPKNDGCSCRTCKTFVQYAAPNQPDGSMLCYSCRDNPVRAYY